ncbi:DUF5342 family protein [Alkalicoccus daliensis]|uniref:YheE family protein n=1 Tax=Alkalicoccus daliensis TaxID=745820 RepID=A0A1H0IFA9_9BACI|nr:DUF5342 family protein [Alkalicoccus daliensis]SDO29751.1 hypothetical protein SAMN04488053_110109 [Alkalicoccus daliensis]
MIQHFQWKERPPFGWSFSFYYKQMRYKGTYQKDGVIRWHHPEDINEKDAAFLESTVHDLMLYHVYEDH